MMKKRLAFILIICAVALGVSAFGVLAATDGPTLKEGNVMDASAIAEAFLAENNADAKLALAKELNVYLFATPLSSVNAKAALAEKYATDGEAEYLRFLVKTEKIMAWAAVCVLSSYNADAPTYECRAAVNWASRFMEYDIENYTVEEVLSDNFFTGAASGTGKTVGELYAETSESFNAKYNARIDTIVGNVLGEYATGKISYRPDFTDSNIGIVINSENTAFNGVLYENGYRYGDVIPKFDYNLMLNGFTSVTKNTGKYDRLAAGSYVIFDEGVTDYYTGNSSSYTKNGVVKRNFVYDRFNSKYVEVAEGEGTYDYISTAGFGQLLPSDPYYMIDMHGIDIDSLVPYVNLSCAPSDINVIQFDISYFDTSGYLAFTLYYSTEQGSTKGVTLALMDDGNFTFAAGGIGSDGERLESFTVNDVVVPGRWTNVAFVVNGALTTVYIDYEEIVTLKSEVSGFDLIKPGYMRARVNNKSGYGVALDNLACYEGSMPRPLDIFEKMEVAERFVYFGNQLENEGAKLSAKLYAYTEMGNLISSYFTPDYGYDGDHLNEFGELVGGKLSTNDADVIAAVKQYYGFDYNEYKRQNSERYAELVDAFAALERKYGNIDEREAAMNAVKEYAESNELLTDIDIYITARQSYVALCTLLENDKASYEFVRTMDEYATFKVYEKKLEIYEKACDILLEIELDESITISGETRLEEALLAYDEAEAELARLLRELNSRYIIMYVEFTREFENEDEWEENYSKIKYPIDRAREILKSGVYDPDYKGLAESLEWYAVINGYFYEKLQEEHIEYLSKFPAKFEAAESYLEKLGVCSVIDVYMKNADIDPNNSELSEIIAINQALVDGMVALEEEYIAARYENAKQFVGAVNMLENASGYAQIKQILQEAESYYYGMIVADTDGLAAAQITEAIEKYRYYTEYEKMTAAASADFVILIAGLGSAEKYSERYAILSKACLIVDNVSEDIEGVADALIEYQTAYDEYIELASSTLNEITNSQYAVATLRVDYVAARVIEFFAELVGIILH